MFAYIWSSWTLIILTWYILGFIGLLTWVLAEWTDCNSSRIKSNRQTLIKIKKEPQNTKYYISSYVTINHPFALSRAGLFSVFLGSLIGPFLFVTGLGRLLFVWMSKDPYDFWSKPVCNCFTDTKKLVSEEDAYTNTVKVYECHSSGKRTLITSHSKDKVR